MKTIYDLVRRVDSGASFSVTFNMAASKLDSYPEPGMKAVIVRAARHYDNVVLLTCDYSTHETHNITLESANYHGQKRPAVTLRAAGDYRAIDFIYMMSSDPVEKYFTIDNTATIALSAEYIATAQAISYIGWLEKQLIATRESF